MIIKKESFCLFILGCITLDKFDGNLETLEIFSNENLGIHCR